MLIQKSTYDEGDIISLKIVNGDEIVAKVISDTDNEFKLDRPCTVIPSQQGIGLIQSLMTGETKNPIIISKQHVIMHSMSI